MSGELDIGTKQQDFSRRPAKLETYPSYVRISLKLGKTFENFQALARRIEAAAKDEVE
jgi:hypothetical protein